MGITKVDDVPSDAVHVADQDHTLPDGRTVEQFRTPDNQVFERVTAPVGPEKKVAVFRIDPDATVRRCGVLHPLYGKQVRCEEPKGHDGEHVNSFFARSWWIDDPKPGDAGYGFGAVNR